MTPLLGDNPRSLLTISRPCLSQYEGGEPCGICGHRLAEAEQPKPQTPSALPTEVLPGFLFLGTYDHASRAELLKTLGIGNILNVRRVGVHFLPSRLHGLLESRRPEGQSAALSGPAGSRPSPPLADGAELPEPVQKLL